MGSRGQQGGINPDDQAFLSQIEDNIRGQKDDREAAKEEAEQRAKEMERIRQATANLPQSAMRGGSQSAPQSPAKKNPLEDDPRYKEYFERLRRQKGEEVSTGPNSTPAKNVTPSRSQSVGPGAIVRFDDSSIGIYKDAVSGKDYALFYFLHPDGQFLPEGVFLNSYQAKVLGHLPEDYFARLREASEWDRDVIVFHLDEFAHVSFLNGLKEHEDRKPTKSVSQTHTPVQNQAVSAEPVAINSPSTATITPEPSPAKTEEQAGLIKGRKFQIKFGGKMWEAVYWMEDEQGAIVAHDTHGDWSLMRLDLNRFSDSLELGDIVDDQTLAEIANSAT